MSWLRILKLSGRAQYSHKGADKREAEESVLSDSMWERPDWPLLLLKTEGGHEAKNVNSL